MAKKNDHSVEVNGMIREQFEKDTGYKIKCVPLYDNFNEWKYIKYLEGKHKQAEILAKDCIIETRNKNKQFLELKKENEQLKDKIGKLTNRFCGQFCDDVSILKVHITLLKKQLKEATNE